MESSDIQLISQFRDHHDLEAVESLFQRYQDVLFGFLVSILKESHDAEDALQETFFQAMKGLKNYREQNQFKAWIFKIARNQAITIIRKRNRYSVQEDPHQHAEIQGGEAHSDSLPMEHMAKEESIESLKQAMEQLPDVEREVVILRLQSNLPFKEIAKTMNCSINTVLGRMHNAKKRLKQTLMSQQPT